MGSLTPDVKVATSTADYPVNRSSLLHNMFWFDRPFC